MNAINHTINLCRALEGIKYLFESKWTVRTYETAFSPSDYEKAEAIFLKQDEMIDDIILVCVNYNPIKGVAIITEKVKILSVINP